jgi:voltage-gated potassium channel
MPENSFLHHLRYRLAHQLDPVLYSGRGMSPLNIAIALVIILGILLAIVQTEPNIRQGHEHWFRYTELALGSLFLLEYLARLWTCVENDSVRTRWQHFFSFFAMADLLAILVAFSLYLGNGGVILRLVLLIRVVRLARLGRFSIALECITVAIRSRTYELLVSAIFGLVILLFAATCLYLVEGDTQPEAFGSIPRATWWAVATLTTVGYGDVYPITLLGRILAGITAVTGICMIAVPTGILASAFSDAIKEAKEKHRRLPKMLDREI